VRQPFFLGTAALAGVGIVAACVGEDPNPVETPPPDAAASDAPENDTGTPCNATCLGVCVDLKHDSNNCGGCGKSCTTDAGITFACVEGACGNAVVQVSAGDTNACVLLLDGTVWCWGDQKYGITGVTDSTPTSLPKKVPGLTDVAEIAVASVYGVARRRDGTVVGWNGADGVTPIAFADKVVQISAAFAAACGRTAGGAVACWGIGLTGVLGKYPEDDGGVVYSKTTAIPIAGLESDVVDVSVGAGAMGTDRLAASACAVKKDGTVWCWGSNLRGELGHTNTDEGDKPCESSQTCNPSPRLVRNASDAGITGITRVHVGDVTACALKTEGSVLCWGAGRYGVANQGISNNVPLAAAQVNGLNTTASLYFGGNVAHVVDISGNVKAWGLNGGGELGVGGEDGYGCWAGGLCKPPTNAPLLKDAKQISVGYRTGVALMGSGKVLTWGLNSDDQLGHPGGTNLDTQCTDAGGSIYCNPSPAEVIGLP